MRCCPCCGPILLDHKPNKSHKVPLLKLETFAKACRICRLMFKAFSDHLCATDAAIDIYRTPSALRAGPGGTRRLRLSVPPGRCPARLH